MAGVVGRPGGAGIDRRHPSGDYYKVFMPAWAFALAPRPLTPAEQAVADTLKAAMLEAVAATNVEVDDA